MSLDVDVVPSNLQFTLIPAILVLGVIVLGIVFLIMIVILIGRRVSINLETGGAVTLTLASILFLSGVWCMMLSPTVTYHQTEDEFHDPVSIDALLLWVHPLNVKEGDTLTVNLNFFPTVAEPYLFVTKIYDPDSAVVWSETNTTHVHFRMKAIKSGRYRVEVGNPYPEIH